MSNENKNGGDENINDAIVGELILDEIDRKKFEPTMDTIMMKSTGLCNLANELFSEIYIDYEGSTVEIIHGTNQLMLCLFFNHRDYTNQLNSKKDPNSLPLLAMSKDIDEKNIKNSTLRSIRTMDRRQMEGDRFYPTKDGADGLKDFIFPQHVISSIYKKHEGRMIPNWKKIVTEVADPNTRAFSCFENQQFTKACFIDPIMVVSAIYGKKCSDGTSWEYNVRIVSSLPGINGFNGGRDNNWLVAIERYSENKIFKLARDLNLTVPSGLNIQRSK